MKRMRCGSVCITSELVRMPSPKNRTPRISAPSVTPVAAKMMLFPQARSADLAPGKHIIFAATGVTDGTLMKGVQFFGAGIRTSSVVMQTNPHRVRFIDSIQVYPGPSVKIRF